MTANLMNEILQLSIPERLELIENIWETIEAVPDAIELTNTQRQELDRRLELYRQNLTSGSTWEEVKQRIEVVDFSLTGFSEWNYPEEDIYNAES